jgi:hypothetical protein
MPLAPKLAVHPVGEPVTMASRPDLITERRDFAANGWKPERKSKPFEETSGRTREELNYEEK